MTYSHPTRPARRRTGPTVLAAVVAAGTILLGVLGYHSLTSASTASVARVLPPSASSTSRSTPSGLRHAAPKQAPPTTRATTATTATGAPGVADGVLPHDVSVFDDDYPAVTRLNPTLLSALHRAATAAADDGVRIMVSSGWRSTAYQDQLLQQAVAKYGSEKEAARWVDTPETSSHVSGNAVDVGYSDATSWLSRHGAAYGLCQIYRNESWHYELRPDAVEHGCPQMYADPTDDPRTQQ